MSYVLSLGRFTRSAAKEPRGFGFASVGSVAGILLRQLDAVRDYRHYHARRHAAFEDARGLTNLTRAGRSLTEAGTSLRRGP
jgi:hypothetical protein